MKNMFKKIFAWVLAGSMLAGVGCKDYDDDIDAINKKLDNLESVTIPGIESQIAGIHSTIAGLGALQASVDALEAKLDGSGKLSEQLAALKSQLEAYAKSEDQNVINSLYSKAEVDAKLAALKSELMAEIAKKIDSDDAATDAELAALKTELTTKIDAIDTDWFGAEFEKYLTTDNWNLVVKKIVGSGATAGSEKVLAELEVEQSKHYAAVVEIIEESVDTDALADPITIDGENYTKLSEALTAFVAVLNDLESRVALLEGRIQSLVYVPDHVDGKVVFSGADFIMMGEEKIVLRESGANKEASITFMVSPASLAPAIATAENLAKNNLKLVDVEVSTATRAAAPANFTIKEVKVAEDAATTGKFTVVATTDYAYPTDKTLMVALKVTTEGNIEYTSDFIETAGSDDNDLTANFVLAYNTNWADTDKEASWVAYDAATPFEWGMKYTSTEPVDLFPTLAVMYNKGTAEAPEYLSLADAVAEYGWKQIVGVATLEALTEEAAEIFTLDAENRTIALKTANDVNNIGKEVTVEAAFTLSDGAETPKTMVVGPGAKHKVTVLTDSQLIDAAASTFIWQYGTDYTDGIAAEKVVLEKEEGANVLTAVNYLALKVEACVATVKKGTEVYADMGASIELVSAVTADGDSQEVVVSLSNAAEEMVEGGSYTVEFVYTLESGAQVTIVCPVVITGRPGAVEYTFNDIVKTYDGASYAGYEVVKNYVTPLWNELSAAAKAQYKDDKANFKTALGEIAEVENAGDDVVVLANGGDALNATFAKAGAYRIDHVFGDLAVIKGNVSLVLPEGVGLEGASDFGYNNGVVAYTCLVLGDTGITGIDALYLENVFKAVFPEGTDKSKLKISYSLVEKTVETGYTDVEISSTATSDQGISVVDNKLDWKQWNQFNRDMVATLSYGSETVATQPFAVWINPDPVKRDTWSVAQNTSVTIAAGAAADVTKNISELLTLQDVNGANVFSDYSQVKYDALGIQVKYGQMTLDKANSRISFDEETGTLKVKADAAAMVEAPYKVTIPVTVTYRFTSSFDAASQFKANVVLTVNNQ